MNCFKKKNYKKQEDEEKKSAGTQFTFYDQYGILRKGVATDDGLLHNRDEELDRILRLENSIQTLSDEDKRTWYIVESGWIRTWLSYVRYGTASLGESLSSPAPAAINNECMLLMTANTELCEEDGFPLFTWVPKKGLLPAGKDGQGHFRRVNCKVWEAFCDMYKGSGPAIKYVEEEPKVVPPPEEEKKLEGGEESKDAGADKKNDNKPQPKKVEEKKGGESDAKAGDEKEGETKDEEPEVIPEDPTRWHDSSLWIIDQDQQRIRAKYDEKRLPHKSKEQRLQAMKDCWNAKRLRGEAKAAEEAEEAAAAAAALPLADEKEGDEEETKKEDDDEEDEVEGEEKADGEEGSGEKEDHPDGYVEDLLSPVVGEDELTAAAHNEETLEDEATESDDLLGKLPSESLKESDHGNPDLRKQSVHVGMDDIFLRAPSQEALEATSQMAQARTEALRNAMAKPSQPPNDE